MSARPEIPTPTTRVSWQRPSDGNGGGDQEIVAEFCAVDPRRPIVDVPVDAQTSWRIQVDETAAIPAVGDGVHDPGKPWRAAGAAFVRTLRDHGPDVPVTLRLPDDIEDLAVEALTVGIVAGSHELRISGSNPPSRISQVTLTGARDVTAAVRRGEVLGRATSLARDFANLPSNIKSPDCLAELARDALRAKAGVAIDVYDESWLHEHGFGGVLAVGGGSAAPPRLIKVSWNPSDAAPAAPHVVLIGKGITFDTGGISVKPAENMHLMKTDMAGGAAVLGAMHAIAEITPAVRVTALVPCAENMLSGSAYRPGDVVTHYGGTTTEVTNTDAEGRMVLADALAYAVANLEPDVIVDIATLTGAMKVALGMRTGALFTDDEHIAALLAACGATVGERWWRLPLSEEHADAVRSSIADIRQAPAGPGAITAALFLKEFTGGARWAHLDIAGPARAEDSYDEVNAVASGFGTRTLTAFVESVAAGDGVAPHGGE